MSRPTTITIDCLDAILFVPRRSPDDADVAIIFLKIFFSISYTAIFSLKT